MQQHRLPRELCWAVCAGARSSCAQEWCEGSCPGPTHLPCAQHCGLESWGDGDSPGSQPAGLCSLIAAPMGGSASQNQHFKPAIPSLPSVKCRKLLADPHPAVCLCGAGTALEPDPCSAPESSSYWLGLKENDTARGTWAYFPSSWNKLGCCGREAKFSPMVLAQLTVVGWAPQGHTWEGAPLAGVVPG